MDNLLNIYNQVPVIAEEIGYEMKTTFWGDFGVADAFGINAIKDTFKRSFENFKDDKEFATELSLVLNWKSWQHQHDTEKCKLYADLYHKIDSYILDNWKDEKLAYYLRTTD